MGKKASRGTGAKGVYRIPTLWNCWGFDGQTERIGKETLVNPAQYATGCINWILTNSGPGDDYSGKSLSQTEGFHRAAGGKVRHGAKTRRAGDWIIGQSMYVMMVRTSTAWDHDGDNRLTSRRYSELGTFLKSIWLLPLLRRMGVTVIYLMPIAEVSLAFRKGELGCPYAARNSFAFDPHQHDSMADDDPEDIQGHFAVFVECAHRLGMRVMLDIAPRTAARDSDWILDHPEWFYWIDRRHARGFAAPKIPSIDYNNPIPGRLHDVFDDPGVRAHLDKFRFAPSVADPDRWANFAKKAKKKPPADLLSDITRHFGVTTAPAFSDCINDPQPPWSDVTYLRLFLDHPIESKRQLSDPAAQPPYVLFDTAKASLFEGKRPNRALWTQLARIIPFYQQFGIDGARVDMAHALPARLERMILDNPRKRDPDFCFLAEELGTGNHAKAYKAGYNILIGPSWWMQPRGHEGMMHKFVAELGSLKIPAIAAAETPDTPRACARKGGRKFSKQTVVVNNFLPNAVPMLNSGIELFERQPMSLGLDSKPSGRFSLPKSDPLFGKLAFFDRYALHWTNTGAAQMVDLIARAAAVRQRYIKALTSRRAYFEPTLSTNRKRILATGFSLGARKGSLLMLANLDCSKNRRTTVSGIKNRSGGVEILLQVRESSPPKVNRGCLTVSLAPGEVMVLHV